MECSFEPEDMASFSPGFKPKSILCSDNEPFCPWLYGINRTQYRAIRISPRTHFRPISASELSPGGCSESDVESEKEEASLQLVKQTSLMTHRLTSSLSRRTQNARALTMENLSWSLGSSYPD